ncbi:MAG: rhodanese-like domain-containing protein [Trichloromonadaceae bacterium]
MTPMHLLLALLALLVAAVPTVAGDFNYISAEKLEQMLRQQLPVSIVDIQVEPEFNTAHIKGAHATYAYPVKSAQDQAKLDALLPALSGSDTPVVIVCPRGAGGAERTQQYLAAKGIAPSRLLILEQGQAGWNCPDLTMKK